MTTPNWDHNRLNCKTELHSLTLVYCVKAIHTLSRFKNSEEKIIDICLLSKLLALKLHFPCFTA